MSSNQLNDISKVYMEAVYGGGKKEKKDNRMLVTNADKKANTPAYQKYKAGNKAYKGADHLKDNYEFARHKASVISRGGRLEDAVESWNQKVAHQEAMKEVSEKKEVNVKDTYKTVAAIVDYDRAKKGSKDATYDSMKGDKEGAKKERDYAAWERSKMKKDDPNWKSKKYHTGMHGEGKMYGYSGGGLVKKKKKKHDCASKVKHEEYGIGKCIPEMHDLDESGKVAHYDVFFEHGIEKNVPVSSLEILEGHMHEHVIHEKKAAKDYDGDGKIESGKDEYFGSRDKAIKKAMGKKVKKESLSDWRTDLNDLIEIVDEPQSREQKEVVEKKVKNKVIINPKFTEAVEEMGGELLEMSEVIEESEEDAQEGTSYGLYKGSGKPSGAMKAYLDKKAKKLEAEKKKQKPEYKNNPAFGDPSHHSNKAVKEGILVKAAQGVEAVGKKIDKADKAVTKATMNRVVKPAAKAIGKGAKKVGMAALRGTAGAVGGAVKGALKGASKGIKKGMREELLASGVFSEHEVTKLLWVEFDESREYSHNPEKYHDSEGHDKKLERDKPYRKRSRAARMADPDRGINSPAFKKFMADRGM